ncbi:hypothetical protein DM01DRAFT_1297101, partial [Hesseltinella vesiculosa]
IGHAGTGTGTRIKGHLRLGGKWHRQFTRQHSIALITNEARTSMVCPYCRERIIHPRKLTMGKRKLNLGTSCCANPNCACYKECKNSFGRDTLSATCIALRAYGQLTKDPIF